MTTRLEQTDEEMLSLLGLVRISIDAMKSGQYAEALRAMLLAQMSADLVSRQIVDAARVAGATWQDVGNVLGVTRQSAEQRFGNGVRRKARENVGPEHAASATTDVADPEPGTFTCHLCGKTQYVLDLVLDMRDGVKVCVDCAS